MNNLPAAAVLPDMCTHAQNGKARRAGGPEDDTRNIPAGRRRWRLRRRRDRGPAHRPPENRGPAHRPPLTDTEDRQAMAGAMQMAIGLLTAGLD